MREILAGLAHATDPAAKSRLAPGLRHPPASRGPNLPLGRPGSAAPPSRVDQTSINAGDLPHFAETRLRRLGERSRLQRPAPTLDREPGDLDPHDRRWYTLEQYRHLGRASHSGRPRGRGGDRAAWAI